MYSSVQVSQLLEYCSLAWNRQQHWHADKLLVISLL